MPVMRFVSFCPSILIFWSFPQHVCHTYSPYFAYTQAYIWLFFMVNLWGPRGQIWRLTSRVSFLISLPSLSPVPHKFQLNLPPKDFSPQPTSVSITTITNRDINFWIRHNQHISPILVESSYKWKNNTYQLKHKGGFYWLGLMRNS
jgi:hypothetical protein